MTYESAPATKLLATHCAACRRPLVDSVSVEAGMGPDCRDKFLVTVNVSEEARLQANQIVHDIALRPDRIDVAQGAHELRQLGFEALARRVEQRACDVRIWEEGGDFVVKTCTVAGDDFGRLLAAWSAIPGRQWDGRRRVSIVPRQHKATLWRLLREFFPGKLACGPKGPFRVENTERL